VRGCWLQQLINWRAMCGWLSLSFSLLLFSSSLLLSIHHITTWLTCIPLPFFPSFSLGIFAYLNFLCHKDRQHIIQTLLDGLMRLEYRGYDSSGFFLFIIHYQKKNIDHHSIYYYYIIGLAFDDDSQEKFVLVKKKGRVAALVEATKGQ